MLKELEELSAIGNKITTKIDYRYLKKYNRASTINIGIGIQNLMDVLMVNWKINQKKLSIIKYRKRNGYCQNENLTRCWVKYEKA